MVDEKYHVRRQLALNLPDNDAGTIQWASGTESLFDLDRDRVLVELQRNKLISRDMARVRLVFSIVSNVEQKLKGTVLIDITYIASFDLVGTFIRSICWFWPPQWMPILELRELLSVYGCGFTHCEDDLAGRAA